MQKIIGYFALLLAICTHTTLTPNFTYLFSHGLYADHTLAYYYEHIQKPEDFLLNSPTQIKVIYKSGYTHTWNIENPEEARLWIIQQPLHTFNYPDAIHGFDRSQTSFAQENEIQSLSNAYEKIKHTDVILVGMSRGASVILNFLGTHPTSPVKAAVLESPFDSILNALNTHCHAHWWIPSFVMNTAPNVLFGKFNRKGICPLEVAHNIDKKIPLFIIASLQDTLIPAVNTASIYLKLLECGHEQVYFLLLDKGEHAYLLENDDAPLYLEGVHAFYQKYNLPHNPAFATPGKAILAQCRPSKKVVEEALRNKKSFIKY